MRTSMQDKAFYFLNYSLLFVAALTSVLPVIHIAAISLSGESAIMSGFVGLWPVDINWQSYAYLMKGTKIMSSFWNSVQITLIGTGLSLIFTILGAYPLTRAYMIGRRFFMLAIMFTMIFGGGLIPTYLVVKSVGLIDSYWALWALSLISPWNLLIMVGFLRQIPTELEDAAHIDGCGDMRLLFSVILPLSLPVMATLAVFYGVSYWNSFMSVLIYINDPAKFNLSVFVNEIVRQLDVSVASSTDAILQLNSMQSTLLTAESVKAASIFIMIVPMLVVYPFLQKYFVKGALVGSIKG
ncbi:carbohydrate ABC transporter permease [Paenibacillus antri]|uniref:Carbohydrate ABC transporter permease n=1 Tax=Paenibacillus antri TaxID=2582848 RepID=A0A5R9GHA5_9BACL|nr:carbohydrate ABC transporter permease [Paenibacillus antri]TLS52754.1 carbohydrate ABC transporter permease [Paenibacillus antri]